MFIYHSWILMVILTNWYSQFELDVCIQFYSNLFCGLSLDLTSLLTMATMKKITKPASTTIAVFVTCIEILRRRKTVGNNLMEKKKPVDILVEGALLLINRGGKGARDEKGNDAWGFSFKFENRASSIIEDVYGSPKRSLPAGCVKITKRDTFECT